MGNSTSGNAPQGRGQAGGQPGRQLTQMDADNDGFVSFEEMTTASKRQRGDDIDVERIKRRFNSIDTNGDGKLSSKELEAAPSPNAQQRPANR